MKPYTDLLRDPMKSKPESKRAARQKSSSTPPHVYRMNYNESPFGMGPSATKALEEVIQKPYTYQDWFAIKLKTKIAEFYGVDMSGIIVGSGSSAIIDMLGEVFINPGDEFVFGDPSYEAFRDVANEYGAVPVPVPMDDNMMYDLDAMYAAITPKTKMVVICNPNNPTATFIDSEVLEAFIRKVPKHVLVVIDEAYMEYVTKDNSYSMVKLIKEGIDQPLVILKTFSKIYAMAGVRAGYAIMSPDLADCFGKSGSAWNISSIAQATAAAALDDQEYIMKIRDITVKERDIVVEELRKLGCRVWESQTNFVLFKAPIEAAVVTAKLAENDILIGTPVGLNRVSIGTPEMNLKFIAVMKEILA